MNKQKVFGCIIISGIVISSIFCNASAQADSVKGGWGNKNSEWQSQWDVKTFFRAIQKGDIAGVKSILSQGLNPNHYTTSMVNDKKTSTNALYQAAVAGNTEVVKLALQSGANPNAACGIEPESEQKLTALMAAVKNGHTEIVDLLLQAGANLYADNEQGDTALFYAVESGQVGMVQRLYEAGASLQPMGRFGLSPLMHACSDKSIEAAKFLLSLRVNVNEKPHTGTTALMRCVNEIGDNRKMASFLIKAGADVNAVNKDGRTALMDAAWYGDLEMVKLLVEHGADIELEAENGDYAILCAEKQQHAHVVEFLKKTIKQKNQHQILDCK